MSTNSETSSKNLLPVDFTDVAKSRPTAAMEAMLNPFGYLHKGETSMGTHRLKCGKNWRTHAKITTEITIPIFELGCTTISKFSFNKPFQVVLDGYKWRVKQKPRNQMWYADG